MRVLKSLFPIAVSLGIVAAITAALWYVKLTTTGTHHLVYFYLLPVVFIAALYGGRVALLSTIAAAILGDYFLQDPLYTLGNDNPLEYGDLFYFAGLAAIAIKCVRVLMRPPTRFLQAKPAADEPGRLKAQPARGSQ